MKYSVNMVWKKKGFVYKFTNDFIKLNDWVFGVYKPQGVHIHNSALHFGGRNKEDGKAAAKGGCNKGCCSNQTSVPWIK